MMGVGLRPLARVVSHFRHGNGLGEMHQIAPESVDVDHVADFERQSVEETSVGWYLGDR